MPFCDPIVLTPVLQWLVPDSESCGCQCQEVPDLYPKNKKKSVTRKKFYTVVWAPIMPLCSSMVWQMVVVVVRSLYNNKNEYLVEREKRKEHGFEMRMRHTRISNPVLISATAPGTVGVGATVVRVVAMAALLNILKRQEQPLLHFRASLRGSWVVRRTN